MRRLAIGRIVGLLLATTGIGLSIYSAGMALRKNAEFHQWLDARPMETAIDLSRPGEITVPFHQTCSISHGEALYLQCDLGEEAKNAQLERLKDLTGNVIIQDANGQEIEKVELNNKTAHYWNDEIVLTTFSPFRNGDYVAKIRIHSATPSFTNEQQTIYAKYQL